MCEDTNFILFFSSFRKSLYSSCDTDVCCKYFLSNLAFDIGYSFYFAHEQVYKNIFI